MRNSAQIDRAFGVSETKQRWLHERYGPGCDAALGLSITLDSSLMFDKKRSPDRGKPGLLGFLWGGTVMGGVPVTHGECKGAPYITSNRIFLSRR
jgi:hypothetical protein